MVLTKGLRFFYNPANMVEQNRNTSPDEGASALHRMFDVAVQGVWARIPHHQRGGSHVKLEEPDGSFVACYRHGAGKVTATLKLISGGVHHGWRVTADQSMAVLHVQSWRWHMPEGSDKVELVEQTHEGEEATVIAERVLAQINEFGK